MTSQLLIDEYRTIADMTTSKSVIKKSRFIGLTNSITSIELVKGFVSSAQRDYPNATHYCYGYRIGLGLQQREYATDAGEPTNSAGPPILSALQSSDLSNLICVVVRYYGGINLGIGGLIRAYGKCARQCLAQAKIRTQIYYRQLKVTVSYDRVDQIYKLTQRLQGKIVNVIYDQDVVIQVKIRQSAVQYFQANLHQIDNVRFVELQETC